MAPRVHEIEAILVAHGEDYGIRNAVAVSLTLNERGKPMFQKDDRSRRRAWYTVALSISLAAWSMAIAFAWPAIAPCIWYIIMILSLTSLSMFLFGKIMDN